MIAWRIVVLVLMVTSACESKKAAQTEITAAEATPAANEYPDITLTLETGEKVAAKQLTGNNIFIFFQPDCDHCQEEAAEIAPRAADFSNYKVYFISSADMPQISRFATDYGLAGKEQFRFAFTATDGVLTYFGPIPTPSIYVYKEGKLIRSFNGITPVDEIVASLK